MLKKLTLLILLMPLHMYGQTQYKEGTITIDFGKKNKQQDTVKPEKYTYPGDEEETSPKPKKEKKQRVSVPKEEEPDFKRDGLFKALFSAGLNAGQIDGDQAFGYNHFGVTVGVGAMVRFHKNVSVSMEILYSMRGATRRYKANAGAQEVFNIDWDYMEVPIGINVHDKKFVMASVGISPAVLVRNRMKYNNYRADGVVDNSFIPLCLTNEPKRFDLSAYVGFQFLIKQHFGLGVKFSYSLIGLRPACPDTRVRQQFNNVLAFRFMYILDKASLKKKK